MQISICIFVILPCKFQFSALQHWWRLWCLCQCSSHTLSNSTYLLRSSYHGCIGGKAHIYQTGIPCNWLLTALLLFFRVAPDHHLKAEYALRYEFGFSISRKSFSKTRDLSKSKSSHQYLQVSHGDGHLLLGCCHPQAWPFHIFGKTFLNGVSTFTYSLLRWDLYQVLPWHWWPRQW